MQNKESTVLAQDQAQTAVLPQALQLLQYAATALRDLDMGYPSREIASPTGQGLEDLLVTLTGYLRGLGLDDEGALAHPVTQDIPVADQQNVRLALLNELKDSGMIIGECIQVLAEPDGDLYVQAAKQIVAGDDDLEIDEQSVLSPSDNGSWVLAWLWVDAEVVENAVA